MTEIKDQQQNNSAKSVQKSAIALREEVTLKQWQEDKVFEHSLSNPAGLAEPKGEFVFYDGPPFATGSPHYGHILASTIKDVIPRYKAMQGYRVARRWGWDCHGLPIENMVEKELGLKSKKDIEDYGLGRFTEVAREFVLRYTNIWREQIPRIGRFVDMDNDYRTMDTPYTESVWWAFKTLYDKKLIYEGFKSMHLCPRCGTTLSNFEVNQGYKDITDISVYVLFQLLDKNKNQSDTAFIAWTTTPWTLPGNAALAVGENIDYVEVELGLETSSPNQSTISGNPIKRVIVAKDRLEKVISLISKSEAKIEPKILRTFKGSELVGKQYQPLFKYYSNDKALANNENGWKIYSGDFVTTTDGTGIVHIAPAFGADDYELSLKYKLPFIQHVSTDGKFKPEVTDFAGLDVKPKSLEKDGQQKTDIEIIKFLAKSGSLYAKEKITHSYPHCWRCETPLLNYASSSWFVKVTDLKDRLVAENRKINWVPHEVGQYRFGNWLASARDWAISRSRYWGAPIPVWRTVGGKESDKETKIIGSRKELIAELKPRNNYMIVRHGEAEHNVLNVISSNIATQHHITDKGKEQVNEIAAKLKSAKIDLIFASPFIRTQETAAIISKHTGVPVITDERIGELQAGIYDGKSLLSYRALFTNGGEGIDRFKWAPEGAETYLDVRKRMMRFLYDIDSKYEGKNILIITHDTPGWLMVTAAMGLDRNESIGSRASDGFYMQNAEIKHFKFVPLPHNDSYEFDAHRPYIDDVVLHDSKGRSMKRVPDVFDCWFESGSMPFAEQNYTGVAKSGFDPGGGMLARFFGKNKGYPADFIAEGLDQTRGWFYSMLVLGVALFDRAPYKNVIVNGLVLAEDGKKMSKSLKNYPDPMDVINKYGIDAVRLFMLSSPVVASEDLCFTEKGVDEVVKKVINKIDNTVSFYEMYAASQADESANESAGGSIVGMDEIFSKTNNILDRWVLLRLNETIAQVTDGLDRYTLNVAARPIWDLIDDVSVWYIRRSRDRFKSEDSLDKRSALSTTNFVLGNIAKLMAPFTPFIAENIYSRVNTETNSTVNRGGIAAARSVHMSKWPIASKSLLKQSTLIVDMKEVRKTVTEALEARVKAGIKVRQPLKSLSITNQKIAANPELSALIKDEVNVKEVRGAEEFKLDTELNQELKDEGTYRELVRLIQDARKEAGLTVGVKVEVNVIADQTLKAIVDRNFADLERQTQVSKVNFTDSADSSVTSDPSSWKVTIAK